MLLLPGGHCDKKPSILCIRMTKCIPEDISLSGKANLHANLSSEVQLQRIDITMPVVKGNHKIEEQVK